MRSWSSNFAYIQTLLIINILSKFPTLQMSLLRSVASRFIKQTSKVMAGQNVHTYVPPHNESGEDCDNR